MSAKFLHIADGLVLPLDTVLLKKAILAKSGAGKSNTAAGYVEETLDNKLQVVILDPKGDWWGLKSSADGKAEGYPVLILGGDHGDIPLDPAGGALVAEFIVESGANVILDISDFSKREMFQFVGDFATAFYTAKKKHPTPMLLVLEEADEMAPQRLPPGPAYGPLPAICLAAIEKIVKRGRFLGIGVLVVTQRSASLNKDVLTQTDLLILMQTTAPQDVDAVDAWIEHHPDQERRKEVLAGIQALKPGEAYVWCPGLEMFQRVKFRRRKTFDSGRTPKIGEVRAEPKVLAKADIESLKGRMAQLVEKVKADDPKVLRAQIRDLQKQLASRPEAEPEVRETHVVHDIVPTEVLRLVQAVRDLPIMEANAAVERAAAQTGLKPEELPRIVTCSNCGILGPGPNGMCAECSGYILTPGLPTIRISPIKARIGGKDVQVGTRRPRLDSTHSASVAIRRAAQEPVVPADGLSNVQQRILNELAELEAVGIDQPERVQLALFCGYTNAKSGGFSTPLGGLVEGGYVEAPRPGAVSLTDQGRKVATKVKSPRSTEEFQRMLLGKLDGPRAKILAHLIDLHPNAIGRTDLAEALGYTNPKSGGFSTPLGSLVALGMAETPATGQVRASDRLFLER